MLNKKIMSMIQPCTLYWRDAGYLCITWMIITLLNFSQIQDLIRDCFVTGDWDKSEDAKARLEQDGKIISDLLEQDGKIVGDRLEQDGKIVSDRVEQDGKIVSNLLE